MLESEAFSDQKIREYAQQLAGDVPLKESRTPGVYAAKLSDGSWVRLRSVSSSSNETKARWTIDIQNNPSLMELTKKKNLKLNLGDR
ncbi:hemagglutinin [Xylella fastidiosa]|nr:hemagglutinin [Xylella fastidiosa]